MPSTLPSSPSFAPSSDLPAAAPVAPHPAAPQPIDFLSDFGFSDALLGRWRDCGRTHLLPLQVRAVTETGLLDGANLLVSAATSAGKSFVAEMAAMRQTQLGRRAVFCVPTKALAEEQYARLAELYAPLGLRVVIATRERRLHDAAILDGRFDLAVMVYEKLKGFLASRPSLAGQLGLVVTDELQILADPERGDLVDLLLTRLAAARAEVQLIALSGVLCEKDTARLADWLGAETLVFDERPIELREGVFCLATRTFTWREFNSGREGEEILPGPEFLSAMECVEALPRRDETAEPPTEYDAAALFTSYLVRKGEQVLIFVPTRAESRAWARRLAETLGLPPAGGQALESLAALETGADRTALEQCLRAGVAWHNADLSRELRQTVEREFNAGRIRVLVATSTLSQGVNLTVHNVIQISRVFARLGWNGQPGLLPLTRRMVRNQGGRAGRMTPSRYGVPPSGARGCFSPSFGRSILITCCPVEAQRLMAAYVYQRDVEPLTPEFDFHQIQNMMLELAVAGLAHDASSFTKALSGTWTFLSARPRTRELLPDWIRLGIENLTGYRLLSRRGESVAATGLGRLAAALGLGRSTAADFDRWSHEQAEARRAAALEGRDHPVPHDLEILTLCALTLDGRQFPLGLGERRTGRRIVRRFDPEAHLAETGWDVRHACETVRGHFLCEGGYADETAIALRKARIALAWISGAPVAELEENFKVSAGTLAALGAHLGWLVQALLPLAAGTDLPPALVERIESLGRRLPLGLPAEALALQLDPETPGLTRREILTRLEGTESRLQAEGVQAATGARSLPLQPPGQDVSPQHQPLPPEGGTPCLNPSPVPGPQSPVPEPRSPVPAPCTPHPVLHLDPRHPGQVWYHGHSVLLPDYAYDILALLARTPRRVIGYTEILHKVWPYPPPEQKQISDHRLKIVKALSAVTSREEAANLILTWKKRGLMLDLPPESLSIAPPGFPEPDHRKDKG